MIFSFGAGGAIVGDTRSQFGSDTVFPGFEDLMAPAFEQPRCCMTCQNETATKALGWFLNIPREDNLPYP